MINNRQQQNGRRRGRNGPRPQGGPSRVDGGNRIDSRARGNAAQLHEKYKSLANDAQRQGDRVLTEYYFQFADHYFRILAESRPREEQGAQRFERNGRYDPRDEFGDGMEGEEGTPDEAFQRSDSRPTDSRSDDGRSRDDRPRDDRPRDDRPRDDRPRDDQRRERPVREYQARENQGRENQGRENQNRDQSERDYQGDDNPLRDRQDRGPTRRENGRGDESRYDADPRREEQPRVVARDDAPAASDSAPAEPGQPFSLEPTTEEPRRRRGRPRRSEAAAPIDNEGVSERIEIDRLPPAVNADPAPASEAADEDAAPRRRRVRRPREDGPAVAEG